MRRPTLKSRLDRPTRDTTQLFMLRRGTRGASGHLAGLVDGVPYVVEELVRVDPNGRIPAPPELRRPPARRGTKEMTHTAQ